MQKFAATLLTIALILALTSCPKKTPDPQPPPPPQKPTPQPPQNYNDPNAAPDFTLESLSGQSLTLSSLRGNVVVLSFWSTHCPACRAQLPILVELNRRVQGQPIKVINVSWESREEIMQAVREFNVTAPVLLDPGGKVANLYGIDMIPTTFLIDPNGVVKHRDVGAVNWLDNVNMQRITDLLP